MKILKKKINEEGTNCISDGIRQNNRYTNNR